MAITYPYTVPAAEAFMGKARTYSVQTNFRQYAVRLRALVNNPRNPAELGAIGTDWAVDDPSSIVEEGSNANGSYVLYAGGKTVCNVDIIFIFRNDTYRNEKRTHPIVLAKKTFFYWYISWLSNQNLVLVGGSQLMTQALYQSLTETMFVCTNGLNMAITIDVYAKGKIEGVWY